MSVGSACQVLKSRMPEDVVLTVLKEMRVEAREFREETRGSFGTVFHRRTLGVARLGALEALRGQPPSAARRRPRSPVVQPGPPDGMTDFARLLMRLRRAA